MSNSFLHVGQAQAYWNAANTRVLKYSIEMSHSGLNEHKLVSAPDMEILRNKANLQAQKWAEAWEKIDTKRKQFEMKEASQEKAAELTRVAEEALHDVGNILLKTLSIDDSIDWEKMKKTDEFEVEEPRRPCETEKRKYPDQPIMSEVKLGLFDRLIKTLGEKKIRNNESLYHRLMNEWNEEKMRIDSENEKISSNNALLIDQWQDAIADWNRQKDIFYVQREEFNHRIENMKAEYLQGNPDSIVEYCDMVLSNSIYPDGFPKSFEIEYVPETRILVIEYQLPSQGVLPRLKEVKYISSKKELKETYISESQQAKIFDDTVYMIALRSIHELFEADKAEAIQAVSFNGWVKDINRATGREENNCILSIQVRKEEFVTIDLANVDPKICFRTLKGVASSKLSSLTPVQPILQISKADKRFVESYEVGKDLDSSTNLAAMDWEDFEHLIRELFEKEFMTNGGEVKITQASRDGGVDAIAFDPDPIRGGKIVIQAKRYTNTVGVSAVRDLYGTTLNEGATKGILVTTADYGPDAYEFAKGKPLTLLNGSNLLHLLQKHGYHANIDIREAKKILADG